jgi:hypothetical protein
MNGLTFGYGKMKGGCTAACAYVETLPAEEDKTTKIAILCRPVGSATPAHEHTR